MGRASTLLPVHPDFTPKTILDVFRLLTHILAAVIFYLKGYIRTTKFLSILQMKSRYHLHSLRQAFIQFLQFLCHFLSLMPPSKVLESFISLNRLRMMKFMWLVLQPHIERLVSKFVVLLVLLTQSEVPGVRFRAVSSVRL